MANWQVAYGWMMDNEDAPRACKAVPDPTKAHPEAQAISGINSAAFPQDFDAISKMMISERGLAVEAFYHKNFWCRPMRSFDSVSFSWYAQIESDEIAKRVFDMAVNAGEGMAVKLLQQAVNWSRDTAALSLTVDGLWGPNTIEKVNACTVEELVSEFRQARVEYYTAIGGKNLPGWLARAAK